MIKIAYCNVDNLDLKRAYPLVSDNRKKKISRFRFDKDKKLSCGAYLLLKKLLAEENITDALFKTGEYGKAYITNYPDIHFNISHSVKYVACGISDTQIGVDIEYNDSEIDLNIAKYYFYNQEYTSIMNSKNPSDEFFKYWVLKESYMKYTGMGFHIALDSFEIEIKDQIKKIGDDKLNFSLFDVDDYKLAIASNYKVKNYFKYNVDALISNEK